MEGRGREGEIASGKGPTGLCIVVYRLIRLVRCRVEKV